MLRLVNHEVDICCSRYLGNSASPVFRSALNLDADVAGTADGALFVEC